MQNEGAELIAQSKSGRYFSLNMLFSEKEGKLWEDNIR